MPQPIVGAISISPLRDTLKMFDQSSNRREFMKKTGCIAAASALAGVAVPRVYAAESNVIQVALVGCGARGGGAAGDALLTEGLGPVKVVAMADLFKERITGCHDSLKAFREKEVDIPQERRFVGFDAYKKAMDCLRPGDVVILATPPAFRWAHFAYAIEKGLNVFMEKPVSVDGPSTRKMLALAEQSKQKNLKVAVGLMIRHCRARLALYDQIKEGKIGDIIMMRSCRFGPAGEGYIGPKPKEMNEVEFQVRHFHGFLWASGGAFNDYHIHQIDECCWMKGAWPIEANATGGRHYRGNCIDQNFDNYAVDYTFADGTKLYYFARLIPGCHDEQNSFAHGAKGIAVITSFGHSGNCRIYKGQSPTGKNNLLWKNTGGEPSPWQVEWIDFVQAIRNDTPYNEVKRGAEATLVSSMGRMAAHTGQLITFEQMLNCPHEFAPNVDKLTFESAAPLLADANGKYPVPQPGITKEREY